MGIASKARIVALALAAALTAALPGRATAEELAVDGWSSGQSAGFQSGFVAGEIAAVRLVPTVTCPCDVTAVTLLFGGTTTMQSVAFRFWEDAGGSPSPGAEIATTSMYALTGSNDNLQFVDLASESIVVNGPFRLGLLIQHDGFPGIARDDDGDIDAAANFIFSGFWQQSSFFGLTGDWILRATVIPIASTSTTTVSVTTTTATSATTTTSTTSPPGGGGLQPYQCYKAKSLKGSKFSKVTGVLLQDEYGAAVVDAKKLVQLCVPVGKDGAGIAEPDQYQCCYKVAKGPRLKPPAKAETTDDFGSLQIQAKKAALLCLPCTKSDLP